MINGLDDERERLAGDESPPEAIIFGDLNDKQSPISQFARNNQVQVLRRETGNTRHGFYVGIDKEVFDGHSL